MSDTPDRVEPSPTRPRRSLWTFYFANLLAVYAPGVAPAYVASRERFNDGLPLDALRVVVVDFLNAPYALMSLFTEGGMFVLAEQIGNLGSFYLFLFGLWFLILGATLAYRNDAHRYRLTFILFVLFTLQAVFFTRQAVLDWREQQRRQERPDVEVEPVLPGGRKPAGQ
ncbi:MAG: hypothetical protein JNL96_24145 [Planctomycetaceae bacterium]|nr:hypothetical protein [Planctomycetaceae bacterium]